MTHYIRTFALLTTFAFFSAFSLASWATPDASEQAQEEQAQEKNTPEKSAEKEKSREEKIERIHIDGGSAKIDELRIQGETKSIEVTPKHTPAYQVTQTPTNQSRSDKSTGRAQWRVLSF